LFVMLAAIGVPAGGDETEAPEFPPPPTFTMIKAATITTTRRIEAIPIVRFRFRRAASAACCLASCRSAYFRLADDDRLFAGAVLLAVEDFLAAALLAAVLLAVTLAAAWLAADLLVAGCSPGPPGFFVGV
jgi:hypothetical protein